MKDLDERFAVIEERIRELLAEKEGLTARVEELEGELERVRRAAAELEHMHGTKEHIRRKIEAVLQSLESVHLQQ